MPPGTALIGDFFSILDFYPPSEFDTVAMSPYLIHSKPILAYIFAQLSTLERQKVPNISSLLQKKENIIHTALRSSLVGRLPYEYDYFETRDTQLHEITSWDKDHGYFDHPSVQDFFTAMAIMELPLFDQMHLLTSPIMDRMVCIFYSSLSCSGFLDQTYSIAKSVLPQMLDGIIGQPKPNVLTAVHCLYQTQEPSFSKSFLTKHASIFCSPITIDTRLSYSDVIALAYFFKHSGSSWVAEVESVNQCHILKDCCSVSIFTRGLTSIQCTSTQLLKKKPKTQSTTPRSVLQSLCCETLSEVLYHIIVFFSPLPVLCTSHGPGYLSYVSCPCIKNVVLNNIHFEPIAAMHWVPGDAKYLKTLQFTADQHIDVHGKELTEFVLLVSPLPWSISFTIPGSSEPVSIKISKDCEYLIEENEIHVGGTSTSSVCAVAESKSRHDKEDSELVAPALPLQNVST